VSNRKKASGKPDRLGDFLQGARHGQVFLRSFLDQHGGQLFQGEARVAFIKRFEDLLLEGLSKRTITPCPHWASRTELPCFWVPYAPEHMNCLECHDKIEEGIAGTPQDYTCDGCGIEAPDNIYSLADQFPPMLFADTVKDMPVVVARKAFGPLTMHFGLCPDCMEIQKRAQIRQAAGK
jgi:hypothetical protein